MQPIIMQDWLTVRGPTGTSVTMSQADWILTAPFQDITFYLDVRELSGSAWTIGYETCPARDEALFKTMAAAPVTISAVGVVVTNFFLAAAGTLAPVSHWTRWKLTGTGAPWDITFRIMASGNSIG